MKIARTFQEKKQLFLGWNGKTGKDSNIQERYIITNDKKCIWVGINERQIHNLLLKNCYELRLRPEPEIAPYDYEDADKLIGRAIRLKNRNISVVKRYGIEINKEFYSFTRALETLEFANGSPFGKVIK